MMPEPRSDENREYSQDPVQDARLRERIAAIISSIRHESLSEPPGTNPNVFVNLDKEYVDNILDEMFLVGRHRAGTSKHVPNGRSVADSDIRGRSARLYISVLETTYADILAAGTSLPAVIEDKINDLLKKCSQPSAADSPFIWDFAYQLERLVYSVLDPTRLDVELDSRIREADENGLKVTATYYREGKKRPAENALLDETSIAHNRALLQGLTKELQWFYNTRDQRRRYAKDAQRRASVTFVIALVVFGLIMLLALSPASPAA